MRSIYIVSAVGWEYDDQNYYRGEKSGGIPKRAFASIEDANRECWEKNLAAMRVWGITSLCDFGFEGINEETRDFLQDKGVDFDQHGYFTIAGGDKILNLSDAELKQLFDLLPPYVCWYEITKVEFEEEELIP